MPSSWSGSEPNSEEVGDLRPEHVEAVFRGLLGRAATEGDVAFWMQAGSLRVFLDGVLESEEYARRRAKQDAGPELEAEAAVLSFLNCWIDDDWERFSRPLGEISPDGVAIVGAGGHLFIYGGTNDNVAVQRGEVQMSSSWMGEWQVIVEQRLEAARDAGRRLVGLVVPEKIAVYADRFPQDVTPHGPRPVLRLLEEAGLPLVYPQAALCDRRKDAETYLRTDSHLTTGGNLLLAQATMTALGVSTTLLPQVRDAATAYLAAGDLGSHFDPPMLEVMRPMAAASEASIVFDNWAEISAHGGHIGTMRVFRRDDAPDQRTVVVFGDSYSFGDDAYQGLSWFLAQVFREVHFVWAPFGWDPAYLDGVAADLVVCQTAERFIGRVPMASVDVRSMAQETISRRRALTEERIFSDRKV
jgi:alginate O-acetyltransferase complex protein AlgJ